MSEGEGEGSGVLIMNEGEGEGIGVSSKNEAEREGSSALGRGAVEQEREREAQCAEQEGDRENSHQKEKGERRGTLVKRLRGAEGAVRSARAVEVCVDSAVKEAVGTEGEPTRGTRDVSTECQVEGEGKKKSGSANEMKTGSAPREGGGHHDAMGRAQEGWPKGAMSDVAQCLTKGSRRGEKSVGSRRKLVEGERSQTERNVAIRETSWKDELP
ncbi:hypothetical protein CYMTET_34563 [Cymbomonas tetramitiformis]|uniref:Uncharacterized protein n=1 Tax=Cymbomonas tetramitiformis TaxID=36881 RepID=A0AAE0KQ36_9CHLO|nr:hypothetical protein CYMTET_34563 [Cymbomonas tetramitiformis]